MQVKKFEARTMKEALELVKTHLGPDAVILSARDNKKSFGLVGEGSVEITAAVSEATLQKKKFVENKFLDADKEKFLKSPARIQKDIIEKILQTQTIKSQPRPMTTQRYIEIDSREEEAVAEQRIKIAAENASKAFQNPQVKIQESTSVIQSLQSEIHSLREMMSQMQTQSQKTASTYPGSDFGLPYDMSFIFEKIVNEGVSAMVSAKILTEALQKIPPIRYKNKAFIEGWVAKNILETTQLSPVQVGTKVHIFLGPSGSGKTTSLVKMASHLTIREKKRVGLLCADTLKVGASDQLRIYAQILNVPFAVIKSASDWGKILRQQDQLDVLLLDMPALTYRQLQMDPIWRNLLPPQHIPQQSHLVLSCVNRYEDLLEFVQRWSILNVDDLLLTHLDESLHRGNIYSLMRESSRPLFAFSLGNKVPEDFEFATRERVLDLIFRLTEKQLKVHANREENP